MEENNVVDLQTKVAENRELESQLTKKNDQFMFDLKKVLDEQGFDEHKKVVALNDMLTELVSAQRSGTTAKQLYGTPTEAATYIIEKPEPLPEATAWKMWVDNTLLLFTFLSVMTGVLALVARGNAGQPSQGITGIVVGAMSGGLSFYLIYKYIYVYDTPGADQSKRPGALKTGGIMALCFIPWLLVFSFASLLPATINPTLDPVLTLVLGAAALGIRFLLKKKYGFQGSLFMRR